MINIKWPLSKHPIDTSHEHQFVKSMSGTYLWRSDVPILRTISRCTVPGCAEGMVDVVTPYITTRSYYRRPVPGESIVLASQPDNGPSDLFSEYIEIGAESLTVAKERESGE